MTVVLTAPAPKPPVPPEVLAAIRRLLATQGVPAYFRSPVDAWLATPPQSGR